jgi:hypothetical protein
MLIGAVTGAAIAATSHPTVAAEQQKWLIFTLSATLLGIAAGEAFGFGLSRWAEVKQYHVIKRWRVWLSVFIVLLIAAGLVASTPYLFEGSENLTENGIALSTLAAPSAMLRSARALCALACRAGYHEPDEQRWSCKT